MSHAKMLRLEKNVAARIATDENWTIIKHVLAAFSDCERLLIPEMAMPAESNANPNMTGNGAFSQ
jgi:hypothetical protein